MVRPAIRPDAAFTALDVAVFLTNGGAGCVTTISFVSTGRDEIVFSTFTGAGGRFVGWLEVVFTTLSRLCAIAEPVKHTAANKMHTETKSTFSNNFKIKLRL